MLKLITRKILQSRITTILVVVFFTVGSSGCATTLGYVPEQIKPRGMEDKNTFTPNYSEVKEWAYDVGDGYDSRATLNRYSLYGGALLGAVAVGAVAGLTAFDSGSWLVPKLQLGNPAGKLQLPGESGERDVKQELHALRSPAGAWEPAR